MFSVIKSFRSRGREFLRPDRSSVTMTVPFMRAYTELLVRPCHKRGAHAIGGMAAFIPSKDPEVNELAFKKLSEDSTREAGDGFDGSWVAHPGMVEACREAFDKVLGDRPNQLDNLRTLACCSCGLTTLRRSGSRTGAPPERPRPLAGHRHQPRVDACHVSDLVLCSPCLR